MPYGQFNEAGQERLTLRRALTSGNGKGLKEFLFWLVKWSAIAGCFYLACLFGWPSIERLGLRPGTKIVVQCCPIGADTLQDLASYTKSRGVNDEIGIQDLFKSGSITTLDKSRALVIDSDFLSKQMRILDGPAEGQAFWLRDFKVSDSPLDPAKDLLDGVKATRAQKSAAWHAFYDSRSWNELEDNLDKSGIPNQAKAALWQQWRPMAQKYNSPPYKDPDAARNASQASPPTEVEKSSSGLPRPKAAF